MSTRRNFLKLIAAIPVIGPLLVAPPVVDEWPKGESEEYDFWTPTLIDEKLPPTWPEGQWPNVDNGPPCQMFSPPLVRYHAFSDEAHNEAVKKAMESCIKRIEK